MKLSQHLHQLLLLKKLLQSLVLLCLFISLAWLSNRFQVQYDWTAGQRNSLSAVSRKVLDSMPDAIKITAYLPEDPQLKTSVARIIKRYSDHKATLTLKIINLTSQPDKIRELGIGKDGALIIRYQGRMEKLHSLNETEMSNALLRLAYAGERWISFLSGHGERSPLENDNADLGQFGKELQYKNIKTRQFKLTELSAIPDNSTLLVLASPRTELLPGEIDIILKYLQQGGNLLWLRDPDDPPLTALEEYLGTIRLPGTIVDSSAQLYAINNPGFILAAEYADHPITRNFDKITLFAYAAALENYEDTDFHSEALISSLFRSWTETSPLTGEIAFDADSDEQEGPLHLAYALTREVSKQRQQRIIIVGDGDFLSNAFINRVGNLDLGLRMVNWLTHDDRFIEIPAKKSFDQNLQLSAFSVALMGYGFLLCLPLLLFSCGLIIWRKRKRR